MQPSFFVSILIFRKPWALRRLSQLNSIWKNRPESEFLVGQAIKNDYLIISNWNRFKIEYCNRTKITYPSRNKWYFVVIHTNIWTNITISKLSNNQIGVIVTHSSNFNQNHLHYRHRIHQFTWLVCAGRNSASGLKWIKLHVYMYVYWILGSCVSVELNVECFFFLSCVFIFFSSTSSFCCCCSAIKCEFIGNRNLFFFSIWTLTRKYASPVQFRSMNSVAYICVCVCMFSNMRNYSNIYIYATGTVR